MRRLILLAAVVASVSCGNVHTAGQDIVAPSPPPVASKVAMSATFGINGTANRAFLVVHVTSDDGRDVNRSLTTINVTGAATIMEGNDLNVVPAAQSVTTNTDGLGQIMLTIVGKGVVPVAASTGTVGSVIVLNF